jgi:hypothetical protein
MKRELIALAVAGAFLTSPLVAPTFAEDTKDEHKHEHGKPDADGTKHEDVKVDDLPAKVRAAFDKDFPDAKITEVEKETYKDGIVHYEIEYKDKDGKEHDVEYSADGEKLEKH